MIKLKDVEEEKPVTPMIILPKTELKLGLIILMLTDLEDLLPNVLITKIRLFSKIKVSDLFLKTMSLL